MVALLDFIPLVLFFIAFKTKGIFFATKVLMVATVVQMAVSYFLQGRKLETLQKFTLCAILLFGSVTLYFHNAQILQWWPTVVQIGIALTLLVGLLAFQRNFLKSLLHEKLQMPDHAWRTLAWMWIGFCTFYAALNAYIVLAYSYDSWVDFKIWGRLLWLGFAIAQAVVIAKHLPKDESPPAA